MKINAERLRKKFKTSAGRKAFDRLQKLGAPKWEFQQQYDGVYLSPSIDVKIKDDIFITDVGQGFGKTVDEVVIAFEQELKRDASAPDMIVVTNSHHGKRSEYTYNDRTNRFRKIFP